MAMKLHYYPETDSLYISFRDGAAVDAIEVVEGLVADMDAAGMVIGLDIVRASEQMDLTTIETVNVPIRRPI